MSGQQDLLEFIEGRFYCPDLKEGDFFVLAYKENGAAIPIPKGTALVFLYEKAYFHFEKAYDNRSLGSDSNVPLLYYSYFLFGETIVHMKSVRARRYLKQIT
jgi:hypothetical protein